MPFLGAPPRLPVASRNEPTPAASSDATAEGPQTLSVPPPPRERAS